MVRDTIFISNSVSLTPTLWLSADKNVTLNGSNVSAWGDRSGNGYNATQATSGNQPLYVPNALNGKPVINFNATNSQLFNLVDFTAQKNQSIFSVYRKTVPTLFLLPLGSSTNANNYILYSYSDDSLLYRVDSPGLELFASTNIDTTTIQSLSIINNNNVTSLYKNGIIQLTQTQTDMTAIFNAIGYGHGHYSSGDIAEILVYNSALSDTERKVIENYLKNKYNLY